ncbi:Alkanal monooxygenase alpha chain [Jeotgalicoccus saudimassiliensis]|uniref:Alkanal monooxygenase alpha chain n=1 Tax=Jeotgalicoccus saudimassiliensis TaxID=1461582 RepID=A0A078MGU4_9STAP|nr:LLM class flavin-dependent oxidoreductase [Jeotgalicoccus saudimassiliensis]CEA03911.1 Alkanal monooxygenase alpha chain [Jeotgalicoccus saudimassiliensis]
MVKLNVLDYAVIDEGQSPAEALKESVRLARHAEALGYYRFWMAEHHDVHAFASSSPEMMMMHILGQTSSIRLGSGGVMIPHYSPLKVAENFRVMENLYPGRVDLGIGNTLGTPIVNKSMNEMRPRKQRYEENISDIKKYVTNTDDETHRFNDVTANPTGRSNPEMWVLSTSVRTAELAARQGIGYTFGLFPHASKDKTAVGQEAARVYREKFVPSPAMEQPLVMASPFVVVADTDSKAQELAKALDLWLLGKMNFSEFERFPSVETAEKYTYTVEELQKLSANRSRMVVGDVKSVKKQLDTLAETLDADELLLIPLMPGAANRLRALELISSEFQLKE